MNIRDIYVQPSGLQGADSGMMKGASLLAIGKKGQVVEGVISGVSGQISINFHGVEVALPHGTVQNATEGETRKFQIMDVSKENIVLKEVGNRNVQSDSRGIVSTSVSANARSVSGAADYAQLAQTQSQAGENLAVLTGADYEQLEQSEGDLEQRLEDYADRAAGRLREQKQQAADYQERGLEISSSLKEELENIQKAGFLSEKSERELMELLEQNNLPATKEMLDQLVGAWNMYQEASYVTYNTMAYIVSQELTPTIENIYHGMFSGSDSVRASVVDNKMWGELLPQVMQILEDGGLSKESVEDAKWLFANDLPITIANLEKMTVLHDVQSGMPAEQVLTQILRAMEGGSAPEKASLDTTQIVFARQVIRGFVSVTDADIQTAVDLLHDRKAINEEMTLAVLRQAKEQNAANAGEDISAAGGVGNAEAQSGAGSTQASDVIPAAAPSGDAKISQEQLLAIQTKRQIAEICLKLTTQSVQRMSRMGINVETEPLSRLVEHLRAQENEYYRAMLGEAGDAVSEKEMDLLQETLQKTADIAAAPAEIIGSSVRQQNLLTFNELHGAAVSATYERQQFLEVYEQVSTRVDASYGDSIDKAFASIPHLLAQIGMENTAVNQRAARILGYNGMEITPENIVAVKQYDALLNRVIDNMKPSVVLDMIRQGDNPLDMTIQELEQETGGMLRDQNAPSDEKYSRFLWQLERKGGISEEEREGYIGIYRLLNNIQKSDGAAIGAVLQTNREMTLGNLLSAVRTMKNDGIDAGVDDSFGGLEDLRYISKSITQQISEGFGIGGDAGSKSETDTAREYYSAVVDDMLESVTPERLSEIAGGRIDGILGVSVEQLAEKLKQAAGNRELEEGYYKEKAEELREIVAKGDEAREYLDMVQIPVTIGNLRAAEQMIETGEPPLKKFYEKRNVLNDSEQEEFQEALEQLPDALESEEAMEEQCSRADAFMEQILERAYANPSLNYEGIRELRMLGGSLRLHQNLQERRNYEVPVRTGDHITTMNVTIIPTGIGQGRVQVQMGEALDGLGAVSVSVQMQEKKVKGLILSDHRQGLELLTDNREALQGRLEAAGFEIGSLSYGFEGHMKTEPMASAASGEVAGQDGKADTASLYQVAKILVKHIGMLAAE